MFNNDDTSNMSVVITRSGKVLTYCNRLPTVSDTKNVIELVQPKMITNATTNITVLFSPASIGGPPKRSRAQQNEWAWECLTAVQRRSDILFNQIASVLLD